MTLSGAVMRRSLLETQRLEHERYLRHDHGWWWSLVVEDGEAVIRCGLCHGLTVRFPAKDLLDPKALSKRGF